MIAISPEGKRALSQHERIHLPWQRGLTVRPAQNRRNDDTAKAVSNQMDLCFIRRQRLLQTGHKRVHASLTDGPRTVLHLPVRKLGKRRQQLAKEVADATEVARLSESFKRRCRIKGLAIRIGGTLRAFRFISNLVG